MLSWHKRDTIIGTTMIPVFSAQLCIHPNVVLTKEVHRWHIQVHCHQYYNDTCIQWTTLHTDQCCPRITGVLASVLQWYLLLVNNSAPRPMLPSHNRCIVIGTTGIPVFSWQFCTQIRHRCNVNEIDKCLSIEKLSAHVRGGLADYRVTADRHRAGGEQGSLVVGVLPAGNISGHIRIVTDLWQCTLITL